MSTTFNNPAEFPEGSEGGGSGPIRWRPGRGPNPAEMPTFSNVSHNALINEILHLTQRVQGLEMQMQMHRLSGHVRHVHGPHEFPQFSEFQRGRAGGPQELEMEGGTGTGGGSGLGLGHIPHEIHEIQEISASHASRLLQMIQQVLERITALEGRVVAAVEKGER